MLFSTRVSFKSVQFQDDLFTHTPDLQNDQYQRLDLEEIIGLFEVTYFDESVSLYGVNILFNSFGESSQCCGINK